MIPNKPNVTKKKQNMRDVWCLSIAPYWCDNFESPQEFSLCFDWIKLNHTLFACLKEAPTLTDPL